MMKIDELKSTWNSLDERLKKQEVFKEKLLKELLNDKADNAFKKIKNGEISKVVASVILIPLSLFLINKSDISLIEVICYSTFLLLGIFGIFYNGYNLFDLSKFNFSERITMNVKIIENYKIRNKREKIGGAIILFPVIALFYGGIISKMISKGIHSTALIVLIAILSITYIGCIIYIIWVYKHFYDKYSNSILKSLDELKELEEN